MLQKMISLLAAVLLAVGCFPLPIGYYTILRIVVCATSIILIVLNKYEKLAYYYVINVIFAILFNPFFPVYLHSKMAWVVIDAFAAVWFVVIAIKLLVARKDDKKDMI